MQDIEAAARTCTLTTAVQQPGPNFETGQISGGMQQQAVQNVLNARTDADGGLGLRCAAVQVTVELKNDLAINGTLHSVDQYMNIKLDNVKVVNEDRFPHMVCPRLARLACACSPPLPPAC